MISFQSDFIEKDNDALHSDLEELIQDSKDSFLKSLFPGVAPKNNDIGSLSFGSPITRSGSRKLGFISVGNKFRVKTTVHLIWDNFHFIFKCLGTGHFKTQGEVGEGVQRILAVSRSNLSDSQYGFVIFSSLPSLAILYSPPFILSRRLLTHPPPFTFP